MRTSAIRSCAHLVAEVVDGRTRCTTMRSSPPITLRTTPDAVYLVGSAAGPLGGDHTRLLVDVGAGARLAVRSAAATMALPGATGGASTAETDLRVRAGGVLCWLLEPTLLAKGCDHRTTTRVRLDAGATLVFREVVVLGRHQEASGSLCQDIRVDVDERPLLRSTLLLGPRWPHADGPAGVDHARAVAQTLAVGAVPAPRGLGAPVEGVRSALMQLGPDATMLTELTADPGRLAVSSARALTLARAAVRSDQVVSPRIRTAPETISVDGGRDDDRIPNGARPNRYSNGSWA